MLSSTAALPRKANDCRPFVNVSFNNRATITALVDSGSEVTALDAALAKRIGLKATRGPVPFPLVGANGANITTRGYVTCPLKIRGFSCLANIILVQDLGSKCVIGADILAKENFWLHTRSSTLTKSKIQMSGLSSPYRVAKRTTIPAMSEMLIKIRSSVTGQDVCALSETPFISPTLTKLNEKGEGYVLCQNNSPDPLVLPRNLELGSVETNPHVCADIKSIHALNRSAQNVLEQIRLEHLPESLRKQYEKVFAEFPDVFSLNPNDVGHCKTLPQRIILKDEKKIVCIPPYRTAPHLQPVVKDYVEKLLAAKVIQHSTSPFCSPLLLVKKANSNPDQPLVEQWRCVQDFRAVNENIVRDAYPLHNLYDLIDKVSAAKVWTVIDLSSGFWNQALEPESQKFTAFAVPGIGHFEWTRSAQGLCNSPAAFQRLLDFVIRGLDDCRVYLDDLVIFSDSHSAHLNTIREVLSRFRKYNLKCRPKKVQVATAEINYLGYNLSHAHGIRPGQAKTDAIRKWTEPATVKEIRQFLGLCSFFRRAVPQFSSIASPLTKLTRKDAAWKGGELPAEAVVAFNRLKRILVSRPCLQPPDFTQRFILTVDASKTGLGAVLSQRKGDTEHPVAYASRTLTSAEEKYAPFHLEYLAMVWATRHFKPYLMGAQFTMRSDHKPLQALNRSKSNVFDRYHLELANYDFVIEYLKGEKMPADGLSRQVNEMETLDLRRQINMNWSQVKELQQQDKYAKALAVWLKYGQMPLHPAYADFVAAHKDSSRLIDGVVCMLVREEEKALAPIGLQASLLRIAHDSPASGHYSTEKTFHRLADYWFWPNMKMDVEQYCKSCTVCKKTNLPYSKAPTPLKSFPPAKCFNDRVHLDLLTGLPNNNGFKHVLVQTILDLTDPDLTEILELTKFGMTTEFS